jgi:hypothetical protein
VVAAAWALAPAEVAEEAEAVAVVEEEVVEEEAAAVAVLVLASDLQR